MGWRYGYPIRSRPTRMLRALMAGERAYTIAKAYRQVARELEALPWEWPR